MSRAISYASGERMLSGMVRLRFKSLQQTRRGWSLLIRIVTLVLMALILCLSRDTLSAQTATSQSAEHPTVVVNALTGGTLANREISAEWQIHDGHLTGVVIHDLNNKTSLDLAGPFSLEMKDGRVLRAQDLTIDGAAQVEHLTPETGASRYSERLAGIAVHYRLVDPLGLFHADWA